MLQNVRKRASTKKFWVVIIEYQNMRVSFDILKLNPGKIIYFSLDFGWE